MITKDDLLYKVPTHRMIGYGVYNGRKWAILNHNGMYPLAYVSGNYNDVEEDKIASLICVHGGITFNSVCYWNENDQDAYIGWDYAHGGDYVIYKDEILDGNKYTYEEILLEIKKTIDILNKYDGEK